MCRNQVLTLLKMLSSRCSRSCVPAAPAEIGAGMGCVVARPAKGELRRRTAQSERLSSPITDKET
jgi:hypothetical protein